jgi:hypothetical protein
MTTEETPEPATAPTRARYGSLSIVVAVIFGLIYADVLWNAIGDLVNLPPEFGGLTPWWLLILDVVVPVAAFVVALLLGRKRSLGARSLFFLIGFGVVACSTVASIAFIQANFGLV